MNILLFYQTSLWRQTFRMLAISCLFCSGLIALRMLMYRDYMYLFLVWNLFLAGLPLVFAFGLKYYHEKFSKKYPAKLTLFCFWLLFFPNAPYIITDLVHLRMVREVPFWLDSSIVFCSALTGIIMGTLSLYLIHEILLEKFMVWVTWIVVGGLIFLGSFGIYLGRVLRWNSWDLFIRPFSIFESIFSSLAMPSVMAMTILFSGVMLLFYLIFYTLIGFRVTADKTMQSH